MKSKVNHQSRIRVLLVDDNARNASLVEGYLNTFYEVIELKSGEECLQFLQKEKVDLVLINAGMQEMNGYETCKKIKTDRETLHIPVILMSSLPTGQERMRSLQSGADDFISKPFGMDEVVARVRAHLRIKETCNYLESANSNLSALVSNVSTIFKKFDPESFNDKEFDKSILDMILRKDITEKNKASHVFMGIQNGDRIKGEIYSAGAKAVECTIPLNFYQPKHKAEKDESLPLIYSNHTDAESDAEYQESFAVELSNIIGRISNFAAYVSNLKEVIAFNYGHPAAHSNAQLLKGLELYAPLFKGISRKIKEMDEALVHSLDALAVASEVLVGKPNHIYRINKYATILAKQLVLSDKFVRDIGIAAKLHDVGNFHVSPDILRKSQKLTHEELEAVKQHPLHGAKLLGDNPKLKMAKSVALTHHERWDGSGYPYGLKGNKIPLEGRIVSIADHYDALRSCRSYRPAYGHVETCMIITEGDGKTTPHHFDPQIMNAFKYVCGQFEEIHEKLK
ncbi:MAG: response regulator [Nitrospiraceae bacterium]|nr:response regulator [Nitrospiraceae bacterium]